MVSRDLEVWIGNVWIGMPGFEYLDQKCLNFPRPPHLRDAIGKISCCPDPASGCIIGIDGKNASCEQSFSEQPAVDTLSSEGRLPFDTHL